MKKCKNIGRKRPPKNAKAQDKGAVTQDVKKGGLLFSTEVPFDVPYHGDMPKSLLTKHVEEYEDKIQRINDKISASTKKEYQEQEGLNKLKSLTETARVRNAAKYSEINTKWYMYIMSGLFAIIMAILGAMGSFLYLIIFVVFANFLLLIFAIIKLIFMNYVFLGFILFIFSIILILQFVFGYVIPLPGFVSKKPQTSTLTPEKPAQSKLDYDTDMFQYIQDFFINFPNIFINMAVNMRLLYEKLAKFFGKNDVNALAIIDRDKTTGGRWDNIYNMQLGLASVSQNIENVKAGDTNIYSIVKPAPLSMQMADMQDLDINKLPPSMREAIRKDKEVIHFNWDVDNITENMSKYKMSCNTYDKNNAQIKLFQETIDDECAYIKQPIVSEYIPSDSPQYYDTPAKIGDKSLMIDLIFE